jgi:hypothetical protein
LRNWYRGAPFLHRPSPSEEIRSMCHIHGRARRLLLAGSMAALAGCGGENLVDPDTGTITVRSVTLGNASDPDGYTITLDGSEREAVEGNGTVTLETLPPGTHTVGLSGLAAICYLESENPQSLEVQVGETVTAEFSVACLEPRESPSGGSLLPPPLPPSLGEVFFVATTGDDANPGTLRAPWKSIQRAMDALGSGQVAYVRSGTYVTGFPFGTSEDTYTWAAQCSAIAPCSILAFPGERPVLHGQIAIEGEGLRLSGFVIEGPLSGDVSSCLGRRANQIDINASHVEISRNEIRNNDYHAGINVTTGGQIQILGNWIHHNGRFALLTDPCTGNEVYETDHGIYWEAAGEGGANLVANNLIHDNRAKGIQFAAPITDPVLVTQNTVVENGNAGILVTGSEGGMVIVNNVVAFNGTAAPRSQIRIQQGDGHLIRRNLTFAPDSLFAGIENTTASVTEDNLEADPEFVNSAAGFAVSPGSPAVDAADPDYALGYDLDGASRPQGGSADLGAYER